MFLCLLIIQTTYAQWNPDAGLIIPFTKTAKTTTTSGDNYSNITDGNIHTYWESSNPLPENYIKRNDLNIFLNKSIFESNITGSQNAFDGILSSKTTISSGNFVLSFNNPQKIQLISIKLNTADSVHIAISTNSGKINHTFSTSENYKLNEIKIDSSLNISSIAIYSDSSFDIFEIAALFNTPSESITFDFGTNVDIGWLTSRHYNGEGVLQIKVLTSSNQINWNPIASLNPNNTSPIYHLISPSVTARYLKIVFLLNPSNYQKAKLHEFEIYNSYGPYGKPATPKPSRNTWAESFGIVGFWGWGYNLHSDELPTTTGPNTFIKVAHLARNYHNIDWDIKMPGNNPDYQKMTANKGTNANKWINWQREYNSWVKAGFKIDASILFNNQYFPDTLWKNTFDEAYSYGNHFAEYFCKTNKLITEIEIGNEPWNYSKATYRNILAGMSEGIYQTLTPVTILPCASQSYDKHSDYGNYISDYINSSNSKYLNGLVSHTYAYIFNNNGDRIAVNPEDPRSEVWSVNNMQRFSMANLSSLPVYVTEFGYDSKGGNDECTHSVCISEFEQAIYGTRMALLLYRLGVKEFYWYFYANVENSSFIHNRSGLTSSYSSGFIKKLAFFAFEKLQTQIGNLYFQGIISESKDIYAYKFADEKGEIKKVILWTPTNDNHNKKTWVEIPFSWDIIDADNLINNDKNQKPEYVRGVNNLKINICGSPIILTTK